MDNGGICGGAGRPGSAKVCGAAGTTGGAGTAAPRGATGTGGTVAAPGPPEVGWSPAGGDAEGEAGRAGAAVDASCGFHSVESTARETVGSSKAPRPGGLAGPG
ncbi:hypothetical protein Vse01_35840 [Micromonospora sediminimaris]|uniref:Uncharacterized protein n=1 Tax=Micromonospora sediminimaris TaxID=547162 RepID=A0A9W5UTU3_9ACTN|nr:hypothetical protein Vse01_35840 [Micromonospora sediminimaris]